MSKIWKGPVIGLIILIRTPRGQIKNIFMVLVNKVDHNLLMLATEFRCWWPTWFQQRHYRWISVVIKVSQMQLQCPNFSKCDNKADDNCDVNTDMRMRSCYQSKDWYIEKTGWYGLSCPRKERVGDDGGNRCWRWLRDELKSATEAGTKDRFRDRKKTFSEPFYLHRNS